jgi:hypothetical protein
VRLLLLHPKVAHRDCAQCCEWLFDEKTGCIDTTQDGKPLRRPKTGVLSQPPCRQKNGSCPKGTPENSRALTPHNEKAYRHYLRCKALGNFPDDAIVHLHAGLIREVEEQVERANQEKLFALLEAALMVSK